LYRYDSRAVRVPLLEYGNGLPLRTPPAGLIGFASAVYKRNTKRVPAFGGLHVGVSNSSSTSTVQSDAHLSDLPLDLGQRGRCASGRGRSGSGAVRTVEVEHVARNSVALAAERGDSIFASLQTAGANPIGPASGVRSGDHFPYSSNGTRTARES